jgi:hypothetical protein
MPYATLEALRAAVPASGSTDHEDHTRGIVDALIDGIRKATVTLSSADILDLHNTPIELVAAPGAGRFLVPHLIVARTSGGTTPYTVPYTVPIQVGDASWVEVSSLFSVVTGEQVATFIPAAVTFATADVENGAMTIYSSDDNPTDGDGTLTVTVWYSIEDVP